MKIKLVKEVRQSEKKIRFQFEHDDFHSYSPAIVVLQPTNSAPAAPLQLINSAPTAYLQRTYSISTAQLQPTTRTAQLQRNHSSAIASAVALP